MRDELEYMNARHVAAQTNLFSDTFVRSIYPELLMTPFQTPVFVVNGSRHGGLVLP